MQTTIKNLFSKYNVKLESPIKWKSNNADNKPGVYAVAIASEAEKIDIYEEAPFDDDKIKQWMSVAKDIHIGDVPATPKSIKDELSKFWIGNETILYIGSANVLKNRINQCYSHILGKRSPHSGADWLKTLKIFDDLNIFYGYTENFKEIEINMLKFFSKKLSDKNILKIGNPMPFANKKIEFIKSHNIRKSTVK